jgi:TfoX/Sxy family transcriptional regulator of competence genes
MIPVDIRLTGTVMAYDERLEDRITKIVSPWKKTGKRHMFGGVCFLVNGNMVAGVWKDFLILRLGREGADKALELPFARPFDVTGRAMKGWVMIEAQAVRDDGDLKEWLLEAKGFVKTLPPK